MKKRLFVILAAVLMAVGASAQTEKGEMGGGINLLYGTEVGNVGIGAKYRYSLTDEFRAEGTLDFFFKNDHHTLVDLNANIQYLIPIQDRMGIYPLLGVGIGSDHYCHPADVNTTVVGINAGCGYEYAITEKASLTAELRYQFFDKNCTQMLLGIGLVHKF